MKLNSKQKITKNLCHYALKVLQLVKKNWCNQPAATLRLKSNEFINRGLAIKLNYFAHKRQITQASTVMEPSISFHAPVNFVDTQDNTTENVRTTDLPLEIIKVTSKVDSHQRLFSEKLDSNPEILFTQTNDPNNKSKVQFQKHSNYWPRPNFSVANCFRKR